MILVTGTKLEAVLAGAVAANQPQVTVDYIDWATTGEPTNPIQFRSILNSASDVTILAAPTNAVAREPIRVSIFNNDTATVTVTVKTDDGTTERSDRQAALATKETLAFEKGRGWYVMAANGSIKQGSGVTGPASSTDNAVVRWDGTTGTITQNSAFVVDDSGQVTSFGGNIAFPASQSASAGVNVLDDYEEGTFTPTILGTSTPGTQTYSVQVGTYTKIGDRVFYDIYITMTAVDGTTAGNLRVGGLPFTANSLANNRAAGGIGNNKFDLDAGYTQVGGRVVENTTQIGLVETGDNAATAALAAANLVAATEIQISGHYRV